MQTTLAQPPQASQVTRSGGARSAPSDPGLVLSSTSDKLDLFSEQLRIWRMRRTLIGAAALIQEQHQAAAIRYKVAMVTLTYRDGVAWEGRHVSEYLKRLREWARWRGFKPSYAWVAEIQEQRQAAGSASHCVHYHVLVWLPKGLTMPKADKIGWWPHGMTRTEWARQPVRYLTKYTSKAGAGLAFPKGLRLYGHGGLRPHYRGWLRWHLMPMWARERYDESARLMRAPGGGWIERNSGEFVPPEWGVMAISPGRVRLRRLRPGEWQASRDRHTDWAHLALMDREERYEQMRRVEAQLDELRINHYAAYVLRLSAMVGDDDHEAYQAFLLRHL